MPSVITTTLEEGQPFSLSSCIPMYKGSGYSIQLGSGREAIRAVGAPQSKDD